jgi:hypothetical protein
MINHDPTEITTYFSGLGTEGASDPNKRRSFVVINLQKGTRSQTDKVKHQ